MHIVVPVESGGLKLVKDRPIKTSATVEELKKRHWEIHASNQTPSNKSVDEDPMVRELVADFDSNCSIAATSKPPALDTVKSSVSGKLSTGSSLGRFGTPINDILGQQLGVTNDRTEASFRRLQKINPKLKNYEIATHVEGDGNCGYRCISFHMYKTDEAYEEVKQELVEYAVQNFKAISKDSGILPRDLLRMAKEGEFQSEVLFYVAAMCYGEDFGLVGYGDESGKVYSSGQLKNAKLNLSFFSDNHFTPLREKKELERKGRPKKERR